MTTEIKNAEQEALDAIAVMLNTRYNTGIAWFDRTHNTLVVDWVDDSTTEFTLTVTRHSGDRRTYQATRDA